MKLTTIMDMAIVSSLLAAPTCESPLVHLNDLNGHLNDAVGVLAIINNGGVVRSGYLDFDESQEPNLDAKNPLLGTYLTGSEFSVSDVTGFLVLSNFRSPGPGTGAYSLGDQFGIFPPTGDSGPGDLTLNANFGQADTRGRSNHRTYLRNVLMNSVNDSAEFGGFASYGDEGGFNGRALAQLFREGSEVRSSSQAGSGDPYFLQRWNSAFAKSGGAMTAVPEPSTYLAGLGAFVMLGLFAWRDRK